MTLPRNVSLRSHGNSSATTIPLRRFSDAYFIQTALLALLLTTALFCTRAGAATPSDPLQATDFSESPDSSLNRHQQTIDSLYTPSDYPAGVEYLQHSSTIITTIASSDPEKTTVDNTAQVHVRGKQPQRLVMPQYPSKAIKLGIEGYVVVHFDINADGSVAAPRVLEAQPSRTFDSAALEAVKQFQYIPQSVAGNGVAVKGVINKFVFQLSDHEPTGYKPVKPFKGPTRLVSL